MQYLCISHACRYKLNILLSTLLNYLLRYVTCQCDAMGPKPFWNRIQMIFQSFLLIRKCFDARQIFKVSSTNIVGKHFSRTKFWIILPFFEVHNHLGLFTFRPIRRQYVLRKWVVKFKICCMKKFEDPRKATGAVLRGSDKLKVTFL